jgi:hypothetical protein
MALPLLLALAGCGGDTSRSLGFTRDPPDEFQVTTRAPLSVPPSLGGELPVPTPGAGRPQEARATGGLLLPSAPVAASGAPSGAERALVAQAGGQASSNIRRQVDQESLRLDRPDRTVVDRLMFWRDQPQPGIAVDPTRESQRLRENAALGRDTMEGTTPVVQPRERSLMERLFGN